MEGAKKNSDKLNTIGVVTVGLTGAALVYLSIVGIEAWYLNETSAVDQVAKFGKQDDVRRTLKGEQVGKITEPRLGPVVGPNNTQIYTIPIDAAMQLVVRDAKIDPANLVPAVARSEKPTIEPAYGRPKLLVAPVPPTADGATPGAPGSEPVAPGTPGAVPAPGDAAAPGTFEPGAGSATPTPGGAAPMPTGGAAAPTGATNTPAPPPAGSAAPAPAAPTGQQHP